MSLPEGAIGAGDQERLRPLGSGKTNIRDRLGQDCIQLGEDPLAFKAQVLRPNRAGSGNTKNPSPQSDRAGVLSHQITHDRWPVVQKLLKVIVMLPSGLLSNVLEEIGQGLPGHGLGAAYESRCHP